jgi:hypothetical protein
MEPKWANGDFSMNSLELPKLTDKQILEFRELVEEYCATSKSKEYVVFKTVIQDYEISKSEIKICRPDAPWKID